MKPFAKPLTALPMVSVVVLGGCEHAETATPQTASDVSTRTCIVVNEGALDEDSVGVSTRPPVRRAPPQFDDTDPASVRLFHDVLAPYGAWVDDPRLGLVWIPAEDAVGSAFVPYGTHGRWTYREVQAVTVAGATPYHDYVWMSDLPWGWVTFHYGRWAYTGERGWAWVAGRRYAGAWVDWRSPSAEDKDVAIIGWGPTPPSHVWRVSPGPSTSRSRSPQSLVLGDDPREAQLAAIPYSAFATPYTYTRTRDLFSPILGTKLFAAAAALDVAHATQPAGAPSPASLGLRDPPAPPALDRGLQQAWMLATPASASAVGRGPELGPPPRLRTWVAGGPRWASHR